MFDQIIGGNSLGAWITALLVVMAGWVVGRLVGAVLQRALNSVNVGAARLLGPKVQGPISAFATVGGARLAATSLVLPDHVRVLIEQGVAFAAVLLLTWAAVRVYEVLHEGVLLPHSQRDGVALDASVLGVVSSVIRALIWVSGIASALGSVGFEVTGVLAGLGVGGMALGLAAQDTVANLFGGAVVLTQRPFKIGDRIEVAGVEGSVTAISLRATTVTNWYGRSVILPNKIFTDNVVTNHASVSVYFQELRLRIEDDTPPERVERAIAVVREIIIADPLLDNASWIGVDKFELGYIEIEAWYGVLKWSPAEAASFGDEFQKVYAAKTRVNIAVLRRFAEEGIGLARPIEVQYERPFPPEAARRTPRHPAPDA